MAKKSTRGRRKRQPPQKPVETQPQPVEVAASSDTAELADEYAYVFADLRRIGLIAAAMFVLLFALAFVLA